VAGVGPGRDGAGEGGGKPDVCGNGVDVGLAEKAFGAAREVLAMRGQYFADIVQYGMEAARQMAFLDEQSHHAVHSLSHRSVRKYLNQRLESEAAKILAKTHLERAKAVAVRATLESGSAGGPAADA
jgi:hypothetical protein